MTGSYFRGDAEAVLHPARRGEVRHRHLHLLRAAQRLRVSQAARHRLLLLLRQLHRRHPEGARPGREDDHPHPERQFARKHEGQDQGGRAHHRGARRVAGSRSGDRLPAREDRRRHGPEDRRSGRRRSGQARKGIRRAERPGAEEQPRSCGHHHRARHGEGRLRLDLVRARADGRLPLEPDRDRADHRPRHPRCAGQDPRAVHQPDRRAGRRRRRPSPRR